MTRRTTLRTTTTRVSRVTALLAACAIAASLASCGRSDPVQAEIDRVSVGLGAISTSGSTALPSVENRKAVYQWAIARLTGNNGNISIEGLRTDEPAPTNPAAVNATIAGQASAANLLLARGYAGLGEISAQEAAQLEAGASLQISPISAALDQWLAQNAAADALAAYDPAKDIAEIEKQIGEKQKLADTARANKDRMIAGISDLEGQVADLTAQARALREQAAEVRGRATGVSETMRLELLTEAVRIGRSADQIEKEAANLMAKIAIEKPAADNLQRGIDELTTQIQLLRTDKDNLRQRADQNAAAAKRARDEAQAAAVRLTQMLGALTTAREGVTGPTDAAVAAYEKAVAAAKKAGQGARESKGQSAIAAGNYQHALADVLATRARGERSYADLLQTLATAQPPLPNASDFASKAAAASDAAKASLEAARAAFEAALNQYSSAGGAGDTQDRLEALEATMNRLLGKQPEGGEEAAPTAPDAPDGAPAADAGSAAAPVDTAAVEAEVRSALEQFIAAAKGSDVATLRGFMLIRDEAARPAFDMLMDVAAGPATLEASCKKAYGKSLKQLIDETTVQSVKTNPMLAGIQQGMDQMGMGPGNLDTLSAADATIAVASDTEATVTFPAAGEGAEAEEFKLVKDGASWKIDMDSQLAAMGGAAALQQMAPMLAPMKSMGEAFTKVAGKLDGGEYSDADAMLIDLNKELLAAMMKSGGLGAPGGGGNGGGQGGG